jgi:hypothetical protein
MKCDICPHDAVLKSVYCPRCRPLVANKAESTKRRVALIEDYDISIDDFRCRWLGFRLDTGTRNRPRSLCFDHITPRKSSKLATSSMLGNSMKSDLGGEEFDPAMLELGRHRMGAPFQKNIIGFIYWAERPVPLAAPLPPFVLAAERARAPVTECEICGDEPFPRSIFCPRCRRFVFSGGHDHRPRVRALKRAWDPVLRMFICYYTGIPLDITNPRSPWYLTFEHRTPGNEWSQVVAASWVNAVKTALSEYEFWKIILEYARWKREGGVFNPDVVKYRYWNRAVKGRVVA